MSHKNNKTWLDETTPYARLNKINTLSVEEDYVEISGLFYADFMSIMLPQSFSGFMLTYAAPRMSRILSSTGQLDNCFAKRFVDTALLARSVMEHGFGPGPGREAAHCVAAMHSHYDIDADDFVVVGVDAALASIELAEKYGWREVTDKERESLIRYYNRQARAFGSPRALPATREAMQQYWSDYLDQQLSFEPQNQRMAKVALNWYLTLFPVPLRPFFRQVLLANVDARILCACGMKSPGVVMQWVSTQLMNALGKRDPLPDGEPDGLEDIVKFVYPDGWDIGMLGTHGKNKVGSCSVSGGD